jgi:XRE family transcriptional regulator, regulator of sulfur utilization
MRQATVAGELFGQRVRDIRSKRGLTQQSIAERADIPQTHLSDIERGFKLPNLLTVVRLAIALDCKVTELTSVLDTTDLTSLLPK